MVFRAREREQRVIRFTELPTPQRQSLKVKLRRQRDSDSGQGQGELAINNRRPQPGRPLQSSTSMHY